MFTYEMLEGKGSKQDGKQGDLQFARNMRRTETSGAIGVIQYKQRSDKT